MADPKTYERGYSFAGFQASNPKTPLPGQNVDAELENIEQSLSTTIAALKDIRRSDGALRNGIVGADALAPGLITGLNPAEQWAAGTQYVVNDTVFFGTAFYRCVISHIAQADFTADLAADRWVLFAELAPIVNEAAAARDEAVDAAADTTSAAGVATSAASTATSAASTATAAAATASTAASAASAAASTATSAASTASTAAATVVAGLRGQQRYSVADGTLVVGQTVLTVTGGYDVGRIDVLRNGVDLVFGVDFVATDGSTVIVDPALASDVFVIKKYGVFFIADTWTRAEADARFARADAPFARADAPQRSRIVNGAGQISQERGTNHVDVTTGTVYVIDQVRAVLSSSPGGTLRGQQRAGFTPRGAPNFLRFTAQVADASLAAGDYYGFDFPIEGVSIADARFGTASAVPLLKQYAIRSAVAGTFHFYVQNGARNRSRVFPFTIAAGEVNTWVTRTFAILPDTTGTWLIDTGIGLIGGITLASGSTFNGTAGAWQAGDIRSVAGATNFMATSGATFDISEVTLHVDRANVGVAPQWELPGFADELRRCQRYWEVVRASLRGYAAAGTLVGNSMYWHPKRVVPVVSTYSTASRITGNISAGQVVSQVTVASGYVQIVAAGTGDTADLSYDWAVDARL